MGALMKAAAMRPRPALLASCALAALLVGCAAPPRPPLYLWDNFPRQQYETLQRTDGGADAAQIAALQGQVEKARASGAALPPGFRAHLGMLQLAAGNPAEARDLWQAEKAAFPESASFMDQLIKRLCDQLKDPSARFVIGKMKRGSRISHAWVMWQGEGRWWILDCTMNARAIPADSVSPDAYVPLYSYSKNTAFRHTGSTSSVASVARKSKAPVASKTPATAKAPVASRGDARLAAN